MKEQHQRIIGGLLVLVLLAVAGLYLSLNSMGLFRHPVYDTQAPPVPTLTHQAVLVFDKTNGFVHGEAIQAANALFRELAAKNGWSLFITDNGAINNASDLTKFDVVIWNSVTGDVLTEQQRQAFRSWVEQGGKWIGIHGSGGDPSYKWQWYVDELLRAQFRGHTLFPQIVQSKLIIESPSHPAVAHLAASVLWFDEFYSFEASPRRRVTVLVSLDENSYEQPSWLHLKMGDHPMIWYHHVGKGMALYSALGHTAAAYQQPEYRTFLENAVKWMLTQQ